MSLTSEQQVLVNSLEDTFMLLHKTQVNIKKCPKQRLTKGYIDAKIQCIEEYWRTYVAAHQDLAKCTPKAKRNDVAHFENEEYFQAEELYSTLKGDLKDMLYVLTERRSSSPAGNSSQIDTSFSGNGQNSTVHLPRIQLPKFTGSYDAWPAFKDLFSSLVHENPALSDVQILHYLKISVSGEAESLLKHVQVTSSNYTTAWQILKTRYGNKRLILNSIMKKLFNQKKMTSQSAVHLKGLLDTTTECLNSLENLEISTASWDLIIIHLLVQKLDPETHKNWEEYAYREEKEALPTYEEFKKFLESKFRTLELVNANIHNSSREVKVKERSLHVTSPITEKNIKTCVMCKEDHTLCHCKNFVKLEPKDRSEFVKNNHLCYNCLVPGHSVSRCKLPVSCRICHRRHHSLLHETKEIEPAATPSSSQSQPSVSHHVAEEEEEVQVNTMITSHFTTGHGCALLATAIVEATNENGQPILLRTLIDQGSEASFISEKAAQLLQLKRQPMKGTVIGVGSSRTEIKHVVQLQIQSRYDRNFSLQIQVYIMPKQLTTRIPTKAISKQSWPHLQRLDLADPNYFTPGSIDLLLGVKEYAQIVQQELIKGPPGSPCAQKTNLGWILFGNICQKTRENSYLVMHHQIDVDEILKSIWEVEVDNRRQLTKEEKMCEDIYEKTTIRNAEGRYIVTLPFRTENPQTPYGNTKDIAKQRFMQLERRFRKSPNLKEEYNKVINDYIEQKHVERVPENERDIEKAVYLPHHAVVREDKETSRTRVVFDASCKGSNNISLNQELLVGPQLQDDLRNLLMRWRMKHVCFVADIKQMYRQILVTKNDANFQRLFWRNNEEDDLQEYRLLRVTFGTAPAPYLAVRTLHQVADDEGEGKPQAVQAINTNFYMDDYLDGADSVKEAQSLAEDVTKILKKGGFELAKWSSNNSQFIKSIPEDKRSVNAHVDINLDSTIKALGIVWKLKSDTFQYNLNLSSECNNITKRQILSDIQKLFDPLGWIAPSTVLAKILMQKLWLERVNWDENINDALQEEWKQIKSDFSNVKNIQIDRWLGTSKTNSDSIQLHGFSDASMRAYAAVVYIRIETNNHEIETKIIAARTRVAPLKTISLPRLELNGALLLSKLMKQVGEAMNIPTSSMYAWTDSSIVIAWLSGEPSRWKTFVANRVVEIVENLNNKLWYHVDSKDNPADLATRGMPMSELADCDLWWKGPSWLTEREINISKEEVTTDLEKKTTIINTYLHTEDDDLETSISSKFDNFNNLTELLKTITYCKRFLHCKRNPDMIDADITAQELEYSLTICIKIVQHEDYPEEIERLTSNEQVKKKSPLRFLNPYLDEKKLLRVGGRLKHSNLPDERKHPMILSKTNKLTPLLISVAHTRTLHGGVQLMLCYLQAKYWIFKAKSMCKKHIHKCFVCAKLNATARSQVMGNLPEARVTPARPFLRSGVDFAGPYQILMSKGRGNKTVKAYVAIFICMSTKAIHIELVGDLSSEAFIGAFRRFVARRGKCSDIWSDQGRNFVGANKELHEAWTEAKLQFNGEIAETLATDGTQWHFIPVYSPSYGGLWEAGVKSIKYHLKRILTSHLTFEEMTTLLCQIEACLNSRPLCPIDDSDPDCLTALTPGHFLIGDTPIVVPTSDLTTDTRISALSRWQHTQKLLNDFWKRWQNEYLSRLQQRPKWLKKEEEFKIGDIVLIKTENLPPGKWSLGRIVDKHPGSDGFTRVYSVKSGSAVTKRTVTKLCPLPIDKS